MEVKSAFPKVRKFHCCKQSTLFPNLVIANKLHGLPLETHAVGWLQSEAKLVSQFSIDYCNIRNRLWNFIWPYFCWESKFAPSPVHFLSVNPSGEVLRPWKLLTFCCYLVCNFVESFIEMFLEMSGRDKIFWDTSKKANNWISIFAKKAAKFEYFANSC